MREDLVFAVRDAYFDVTDLGIEAFTLPAIAEVEIVAEKLRTLVQRAQPRDLFDLRLQLTDAGWHLDPVQLRKAVDAKLSITRYERWKPRLWRTHLDEIGVIWGAVLAEWIEPERIPSFDETVVLVVESPHRCGEGLVMGWTLSTEHNLAHAAGLDASTTARTALTLGDGAPSDPSRLISQNHESHTLSNCSRLRPR